MLNCSVESSLTLLRITSWELIGSSLILFIYLLEFILEILWYMKINTLLPRFWRTRGNDICITCLREGFSSYAGHKLMQRVFFQKAS